MPHTQVIEQLKASLQTAYRQAIDADSRLDELKKPVTLNFIPFLPMTRDFPLVVIVFSLMFKSLPLK